MSVGLQTMGAPQQIKKSTNLQTKKNTKKMGKTNGLVGGVTGKFGNIIGYYRRGKFLGRAYNPHTTNVKSRLQQRQRARFTILMEFLRSVLSVLRIGFQFRYPSYQLPFAIKANMPYVTNSNPNDTEISYADIQLSDGMFDKFANVTEPPSSASGKVKFKLTEDDSFRSILPAEYDNATGLVYVACYCPIEKKWVIATPFGENELGTEMQISCPAAFIGSIVHIYAFLALGAERVLGEGIPAYCSATMYVGSVEVE